MEGLHDFFKPGIIPGQFPLMGLYLLWVLLVFFTGVAVWISGAWLDWVTYRDKEDLKHREVGNFYE